MKLFYRTENEPEKICTPMHSGPIQCSTTILTGLDWIEQYLTSHLAGKQYSQIKVFKK